MDLCLDQIEKLLTGVYTISPEFNNTRAKINRIVEFRIGEFLETRTPNDYECAIEFYAVRLLNNGPNSEGIHQQLTYHLIKYLGFSIEKRQDLLEFLLGKTTNFEYISITCLLNDCITKHYDSCPHLIYKILVLINFPL